MEEIPNRFDRIVSMLIQLQSRRVVKAHELADRYGVSLRTIYRDIRSLETAGVPVVGEAGTGYTIMEGYRLPPVMFSRQEASSFVAAEKLMQKYSDQTSNTHFSSAMAKIKSVLRGSEKDMIETLETKIAFQVAQGASELVPNVLHTLFESITNQQQVFIHYQAFQADEPTPRQLEPVGIFHQNQFWYLYAWCHLRNDYRQFRLDRLSEVSLTEKHFSRQHPTLAELRDDRQPCEGTTVRISVAKSVVRYLQYDRHYHGFQSETDHGDQVEMQFNCPDPERNFARWFLMFADHATILEPESLKQATADILHAALAKNPGQ